MAIKVVLVDGKHHPHHLTGGLFRLLFILVKRTLHVAKLTLHAERRRNELHCGNQLIGGEILKDLNILIGLIRSFGLGLRLHQPWGRGLGPRRSDGKSHGRNKDVPTSHDDT